MTGLLRLCQAFLWTPPERLDGGYNGLSPPEACEDESGAARAGLLS